jgi:hypothetical protein
MLPRSAIIAVDYHQPYIDLVKEDDIREALKKNTKQFSKLLKKIPSKKIDHAYAEGKWTIREMLQHILDAERVFTYRALRLSRLDPTPIAGFDENAWAAVDGGAKRNWKDLLEEFKSQRKATQFLWDTFTDEQLQFTGTINEKPVNLLAVTFILPGHVAHHMQILKERYL